MVPVTVSPPPKAGDQSKAANYPIKDAYVSLKAQVPFCGLNRLKAAGGAHTALGYNCTFNNDKKRNTSCRDLTMIRIFLVFFPSFFLSFFFLNAPHLHIKPLT